MKPTQCRILRKAIVMSMIVSMSVVNVPVLSFADPADQGDTVSDSLQKHEEKSQNKKIEKQAVQIKNPTPKVKKQTPVPSLVNKKEKKTSPKAATRVETDPRVETTEAIDGMTMLYIGGAIGAVALLAVALGSSSSSDSSSSLSSQTTPAVGPNLHGNDWAGFIDLKQKGNEGYQGITASIAHNGSGVQIATTTTFSYGKVFTGSITSSGSMTMYDSVTGETWTTHKGRASAKQIDLYDFVNDYEDLDRVFLSR